MIQSLICAVEHHPSSPISRREAVLFAWTQEHAPHGILTTNEELRIETWNDWLETRSGLKEEEVLGRPLFEVFPDLKTRRIASQFERALLGESSVLSTALHGYLLPMPPTLRECGMEHMAQTARIGPLLLDKQICGAIAIIEDVTEREYQAAILRRQQADEELLSWALAHLLRSQEPETVARELFPKVAAHLAAEVYLNYLVEAGSNRMRLHAVGGLTLEDEEKYATLRIGEGLSGACAAKRQSIVMAQVDQDKSSAAETARALGIRSLVCHPLLSGQRLVGTVLFATRQSDSFKEDQIEFLSIIAQYVAVAVDRAANELELIKAQEALSRHAEELEDKVIERTARLQETIAQLESFSYTVAHDLRAPIRSLRGYSEILLEDYASEIPEKALPHIDKIYRSACSMELLTRDLLQFSRISRQEFEPTEVDLDRLVRDVISLTPSFATGEMITVRSPLPAVVGHPTLLRQCISNLLDNAVKFVAPGVAPKIVVRGELVNKATPVQAATGPVPAPFNPAALPAPAGSPQTDAGKARVRIWVEDNGIGIAPEFQQKVFGIFERVAIKHGYEGTGIGLAIVAKAMQRMAGTYGLESVRNQGSRFWIELPAAVEKNG